MIKTIEKTLDGIYVKDIVPYIIIGIVLFVLVDRPYSKYKAREYCKSKGLADDLPKLKWYEWWL